MISKGGEDSERRKRKEENLIPKYLHVDRCILMSSELNTKEYRKRFEKVDVADQLEVLKFVYEADLASDKHVVFHSYNNILCRDPEMQRVLADCERVMSAFPAGRKENEEKWKSIAVDARKNARKQLSIDIETMQKQKEL